MFFFAFCTLVVVKWLWFADQLRESSNRLGGVLWLLYLGGGVSLVLGFGSSARPYWNALAWLVFATCIALILLKLWLVIQARARREVAAAPHVKS